jgi:phospholipid N-methyltransferase
MQATQRRGNTIDDRVVFLQEFLRQPRQIASITPSSRFLVRRIVDPRLIVHCGSALELREPLARYGLPAPDAVIPGIPFSTIGPATGSRILETISSVLVAGGRFVAYQWSRQVDALARPLLGRAQVEMAPFNIPPMRLYRWAKRANGEQAVN